MGGTSAEQISSYLIYQLQLPHSPPRCFCHGACHLASGPGHPLVTLICLKQVHHVVKDWKQGSQKVTYIHSDVVNPSHV